MGHPQAWSYTYSVFEAAISEYREASEAADPAGAEIALVDAVPELLTRGRALADKRGTRLTAVVFGHQLDQGDQQEAVERGADRVLALEAPQLET